jgi:NAD-dependent deacetylase
VVWFHEQLPIEALSRAFEAAENCQVMLVVGTSGVVYPANRLAINALYKGAFVVEVNPMASELTDRMSLHLQGKAGEILPQIVAAVKAGLAG